MITWTGIGPGPAINDFTVETVYSAVDKGVCGWTTIMTLTPSAVSGFYTEGHINITVDGDTQSVGFGRRESQWNYYISNAAPIASVQGTDVIVNNAPGIRVITSGTALEVQVESSDGTHIMDAGLIEIKAYLPDAPSGILEWTIS